MEVKSRAYTEEVKIKINNYDHGIAQCFRLYTGTATTEVIYIFVHQRVEEASKYFFL